MKDEATHVYVCRLPGDELTGWTTEAASDHAAAVRFVKQVVRQGWYPDAVEVRRATETDYTLFEIRAERTITFSAVSA